MSLEGKMCLWKQAEEIGEIEVDERKYNFCPPKNKCDDCIGIRDTCYSYIPIKQIDELMKLNENMCVRKNIEEQTDIELLKKEILKDREKIDKQLAKLQKFQEQKVPISETIKLTSLKNTMQNIKQDTVLEERDEETGKIIEYRKLFALKI